MCITRNEIGKKFTMQNGYLRRFYQLARYSSVVKILKLVDKTFRKSQTPLFLPQLLNDCESASVISFSPHPDDDILAVGGTLYKHALNNSNVVSLVLTKGDRGTSHAVKDSSLPDKRRLETEKASEILKLNRVIFLNEPDGRLKLRQNLVESLVMHLREYMPDIIYTPFPVDLHRDHLTTSLILAEILRISGINPKIRCYESIVPLIPNTISDITSVAEHKRLAIRCFQSQNEVSNYENTILEGLNRLRSHGLMKGQGYAEGLFELDRCFLEQICSLLD
ncbi:PIG-L family deacetylase [bacterium]|nr:PIG-L family deacetylase [candidate division CSSED10-310 bacterium]